MEFLSGSDEDEWPKLLAALEGSFPRLMEEGMHAGPIEEVVGSKLLFPLFCLLLYSLKRYHFSFASPGSSQLYQAGGRYAASDQQIGRDAYFTKDILYRYTHTAAN